MNSCPQDMNAPAVNPSGPAGSGTVCSLKLARGILVVLLLLEAVLLMFGPHLSDHLPKINTALAAGKRPDWWDDAAIGIHYAAWINAVLIVLLLITSKWWTRPTSLISNLKSQISNPRWFWPLTIIAILTCLGLRYPLASKSLWWDEAWVILQASHGKWTPDKKHPGELKFQAHDWSRCAWYYQKPTNHAPMSLLQKASITSWQVLTGAKREQFSDLAARAPALLASCVAVGMMACLLRAWGRPGAGIFAAFLLAMHPWAIRYGVDARAYALVIPLCISGMFAITRIVASRGGKTWPWVWWGVTEFLWLWAFPNAVIDIAALNLLTAWLLWKGVEKKDRSRVLMRLVVTNFFAAMCFIQMFLPNVMQARRWAGQEADKHVLDWGLVESTFRQLFFGDLVPRNDEGAIGVATILGIVCLVRGIVTIVRQRRALDSTAVVSSVLLSSVAFALTTWTMQSYFYPRFVIASLPALIAALVINFHRRISISTEARDHWIGDAHDLLKRSLKIVGFAVLALVMWSPSLQKLLTQPIAPLHDVASFVQHQAASPKPLIACYGLGREVMPVYEPSCLPVENLAGVEALMQKAKTEQRPLYLIYGYNTFNRSLLSDGFKLLDDKALFEEVKAFPGIEPEFYFRVLKAK